MKIFVIGAEGSGKTVFLAMLSRYLNTHHGGLVLEPADFQTSQYIVDVQHTLEQGEWPPSTRMGQSFVLKYKFGIVGKTSHDLLMYDAAGQDLRTLMLAEDLEDLTPQDTGSLAAFKANPGGAMPALREQINSADVLVYLLDLKSLLGTTDLRVQNENCWLLKTFLSHPHWKNKQRIVLLSKKDEYEALLSKCGHDLRSGLKKYLPTFYSLGHHLDQSSIVVSAISSVDTETVLGEDGSPLRRPRKPFRPGDMSAVATFLADIASTPPAHPQQAAGNVLCTECSALIQKSTSFRFGGKCAICAKKPLAGQGAGCLLAILAVLGSSSCIAGFIPSLFCR